MSNRDRIAHLRAEADAAAKEKAEQKAAKAAEPGTPGKPRKAPSKKKAPSSGKVRIVWVVCDQSGKTVQQFPYAQEQEARAEAQQRSADTGRTHFVKQADVAAD